MRWKIKFETKSPLLFKSETNYEELIGPNDKYLVDEPINFTLGSFFTDTMAVIDWFDKIHSLKMPPIIRKPRFDFFFYGYNRELIL